jgi:heptosyltransferase II
MSSADWRNLLILQTSFIGDTVLTLPLIVEVRRRFPVDKLTLVCQPSSAELLRLHPAIDEIIVDDKKNADRGIGGLRRKAQTLAEQKFTIALTPHKSLRSALLLYLAGIPRRIGFAQSRGWFLFHQRIPRDSARHDVERNLSLLKAFDVAAEDCQRTIELPVSVELQTEVDQKLAALGIGADKPIIGINPGSVWPTKRWMAQGFIELISKLKHVLDCRIMLFGGVDDTNVVNQILAGCGAAATNLVGKITLRELPAAIRRCDVFVTNDSGPMHVAVAERVPTVAVFCATTRDLGFFPYTQHAIVVEKNLSCRPCTTHGGRRCPLGTEACSRMIDSTRVLAAVQKLLRGAAGDRTTLLDSFEPEVVCI